MWGRQSQLKPSKIFAKSEREQDNRTPLSSWPPFWALLFCLSDFVRGSDINVSLARHHRSGAEATRSPLPGMGHLVSPTCPRAGAAPARGSGAQPAVGAGLGSPDRGVLPRPGMAHSRVRYPCLVCSPSHGSSSQPPSCPCRTALPRHSDPAEAQLSPDTIPGEFPLHLGSRD